MKNKYILGLAIVSFLFGDLINAATVGMVRSGIDLYQSNIEIVYTKNSLDDHVQFECFGDTEVLSGGEATIQKSFTEILGSFGNDIVGDSRFSFDGSTGSDFIELAIDDPTNPSTRNCFQQAGTYEVNITLSDAIGNTNAQSFNFVIKATDPDSSESSIDDVGGCENVYANNNDQCRLQLVIRDQFKNNVLELAGQNIKVYDGRGSSVDPWAADDANLGIPFLEGVKLVTDYLYTKLDIFNSITMSVGSGAKTVFRFLSLTPSLQTDANDWQNLTTRNYPVVVRTSDINTDGTIGTPDIVSLSTLTAPLTFLSPVELNPEITAGQYSGSFSSLTQLNASNGEPDCGDPSATSATICPEWGANQVARVNVLQRLLSPLTGLTGQIVGAFQRFTYPTGLYKVQYSYDYTNPNPPFDTLNQEIFSGNSSYPLIDLNFFAANTDNSVDPSAQSGGSSSATGDYSVANTDFNYQYIWDFVTPAIAEWFNTGSASNALEIKTKTQYTLDSKNISYFAGKHQLDADNNVLDILIEGYVSGSLGKVSLIDNLVRIGGISSKDIRAVITSNAFKLARGANNIQTSDYSLNVSDFSSEDVVVVEGADVRIGSDPTGTMNLPSGKKTLLVIDGNVNINSNLNYDSAEDSFGVILLNTQNTVDSADTGTYPETGNIFVHSDVMSIVGSYFADGGIITSNTVPGSFATVDHSSTKQLLLTGSLTTRNTIGGSSAPDGDNYYSTPWGKIENDGGSVGQTVAKRYDLRTIRAFSPTGGSDLNPGEDGHPFILRSDRKSTATPPPGFETQETISR